MTVVKIDYSNCIGCMKCYDLCPMDVYTWDTENKKPVVTYEEECWMCGICWMDCPKRAIDIRLPASNW
jgi:NAD-dependent dihydropyrimidine dehydrogenase PreA subunit